LTEKRNCEYYESSSDDHLEKMAIQCEEKIKTLKINAENLKTNTRNLQHNLKNILFVLKSRNLSKEEK